MEKLICWHLNISSIQIACNGLDCVKFHDINMLFTQISPWQYVFLYKVSCNRNRIMKSCGFLHVSRMLSSLFQLHNVLDSNFWLKYNLQLLFPVKT